jgi:plastocyanin
VDNDFQPAAIAVGSGATVTWTWSGTADQHNVTFANAAIASSSLQSSGTHTATMPAAAGTYSYQCTRHVGMTGSVQVQP